MDYNAEMMSLIAGFDTGDRTGTLEQMQEMRELFDRTMECLSRMTDADYDALEIPVEQEEQDAV